MRRIRSARKSAHVARSGHAVHASGWRVHGRPRVSAPAHANLGERRGRRLRITVGASSIVILSCAGVVAYHYVSSSGTGAQHASTGRKARTDRNLPATDGTVSTVTVVAVVTTKPHTVLHADFNADVLFHVKNPNRDPLTVVKVAWTGGAITADAAHKACTTPGVTFSTWTGAISIPSQTATRGYPIGYPILLVGHAPMRGASSEACQGATISIPLTLTVEGR